MRLINPRSITLAKSFMRLQAFLPPLLLSTAFAEASNSRHRTESLYHPWNASGDSHLSTARAIQGFGIGMDILGFRVKDQFRDSGLGLTY